MDSQRTGRIAASVGDDNVCPSSHDCEERDRYFRQDWQNYLDDQKISTGIPVALASLAVCAATYEGNNLTNY